MEITVTMTQPEINDAIQAFLTTHGVVSPGRNVDITLVSAGRGAAGHSAVISIKSEIAEVKAALEGQIKPKDVPVNTAEVKQEDNPFAESDKPAEAPKRGRKAAEPEKVVSEPVAETKAPAEDDLFSAEENNVVESVNAAAEEESLFSA